MIGTTIEWYDFYLDATASALVFKPLFFPNVSSTAGTLLPADHPGAKYRR
jgi:hypothetical protein